MLATAALLVGSGPALAQEKAQPVTLRDAIGQDIDSLNPFAAVVLSSTQVGRLMYEHLTQAGPDNTVQPGLAESWRAAAEKFTWTFTIREANWSDGKPITARDVAFTYNLIMSNPKARAANGSAVENYASVTATDDRTLVIVTKARPPEDRPAAAREVREHRRRRAGPDQGRRRSRARHHARPVRLARRQPDDHPQRGPQPALHRAAARLVQPERTDRRRVRRRQPRAQDVRGRRALARPRTGRPRTTSWAGSPGSACP